MRRRQRDSRCACAPRAQCFPDHQRPARRRRPGRAVRETNQIGLERTAGAPVGQSRGRSSCDGIIAKFRVISRVCVQRKAAGCRFTLQIRQRTDQKRKSPVAGNAMTRRFARRPANRQRGTRSIDTSPCQCTHDRGHLCPVRPSARTKWGSRPRTASRRRSPRSHRIDDRLIR